MAVLTLCVLLPGSSGLAQEAGDTDGDGQVSLSDAVLALKVDCGLDVGNLGIHLSADVNSDSHISVAEAIHIMQLVAGDGFTEAGSVVINEFLASNGKGLADDDGDTSDWIELHNKGTAPVNLAGWELVDGSGVRWVFPEVTLQAGAYLVVFASGKNRKPDVVTINSGISNLHTSFQLSQDGEYLALVHPTGIVHPSNHYEPGYPQQYTDISFGRTSSFGGGTGELRYLKPPTPGIGNFLSSTYEGVVEDTTISVDHGFFDSPFQLAISTSTIGAEIRYTLDGSIPRASVGTLYTGPLQISETTILRAAAFLNGWRSSNVHTRTYIFVDDVITQSPDGQAPGPEWPSTAVNGQRMDYGMDPDVVNDPRYAADMAEALTAIPSISLVTDPKNLFDPQTGIYVNAINQGEAWERPVSAELIHPDGSEGFRIDAGFRIRGGASRNDWNPKHAFRLFFRQEYGSGKLRYPLFGDEGADRFDKIDIRTTMNYAWPTWKGELCTMNRDVVNRDIQRDMGHPYTRSRYYHLYLNGVYWGLFQTQERSEARYAETYLGGDKSDYDVVKVDSGPGRPYTVMATDGNLDAWHRLWDQANAGFISDAAYYRVQGCNADGTPNPAYEVLLDVDNLIDYMLIIFHGGNLDSPITRFGSDSVPNNFYGIYNRSNPDGFKFFIHDAEHTMLLGNVHGYGEELYTDRTGPLPAGNNRGHSNPQWLHQQLVAHPEYRMHFADRAHRHFFNGGLLTPDACIPRFLARIGQIETAVIAESARWGDTPLSSTAPPRTKGDDWQPVIDDIVNTWFPQRTDIVVGQLRSKGWYPSADAPVLSINAVYQHGGDISDGDSLAIANPNATGTIYYTTDGSDPRLPSSGEAQHTLIAENDTKRVLAPTGDIGTSWRSGAAFNDSGWTPGTGGVGYENGTGYEAYINIDVKQDMYAKQTSCYIRIPFSVSPTVADSIDNLTLRVRYDDGFVAYLNGIKVAEGHAPPDPQWNSAAAPGAGESSSFRDFGISEWIGVINSGENLLAIHALNLSSTSSDFLNSVEMIAVDTPEARISANAQMYASAVSMTGTTQVRARVLLDQEWSALNEAIFILPGITDSLRITEIMFHAEEIAVGYAGAEFVELKNVGTEAINLVGTRFTEGIHFTFPNWLLAPDDVVLVTNSTVAFNVLYPETSAKLAGVYTGNLDNGGERIRLENPAGATIHDFSYGDGWYPITDGDGFSLTIIDAANADKSVWDTKEGWRPSTFSGGSPGKDDGDLLPNPGSVVINEVLSHSHAQDPDWIELYSGSAASINIGGWYLSDDSSDLMKYEIPAGTAIPAGGYLVFYQDQHFGSAFALSENGETVYLSSGQSGTLTGYRAEEAFGASETDVAFGRFEKSTGTFNFVAMSENTPAEANAYPKVGPIIITELMYHPATGNEGEEYVELHNTTDAAVVLQAYDEGTQTTTPWQFTDGIEFEFSLSATIPSNGYLILAKDPAAFGAAYAAPVSVTVLGPYDGQLSNGGEKLEISMPGDVDDLGERQYIRIDRVNYDDEAPWPIEADGGGSSLSRVAPADYGNDVVNWEAAAPTPGY